MVDNVMKWIYKKVLSGMLLGMGFALIAPFVIILLDDYEYEDEVFSIIDLFIGDERQPYYVKNYSYNPKTMIANIEKMSNSDSDIEFNVMVKNIGEEIVFDFHVKISLYLKGKIVRSCEKYHFKSLAPGLEENVVVTCEEIDLEVIKELTKKAFVARANYRT
ncbi:MAG: hypothetical protein MJK12_19240 [Colwellia sp.]|nr:hypothetical protein [Colwellia sp.]